MQEDRISRTGRKCTFRRELNVEPKTYRGDTQSSLKRGTRLLLQLPKVHTSIKEGSQYSDT